MGNRGPIPARSEERRRRNQPETPIERVALAGEVEIPAADETWNATAAAWYRALSESGQSRFYEPSDWANAHFCARLMSDALNDDKVNAQLVGQIRGLMADLLTTEGARRRVGIELDRKVAGAAPAEQSTGSNVTAMDDRRKRLTDAS